ncbi:MAG: agmatinase [Haloarculaceae archaeon]
MFPGADADRDAAEYAVVGAGLDASTTFQPGARFGPRRVRHYARGFENYDRRTGQRFTDLAVHDAGDVGTTADVAEYLDFLRGTLADLRESGAVPLTVGGEHTVSVAGVRATDPDVFVALDAHLDLRESYAGDPLSHATVTRHALDAADRAVVVGARAGSEAEWERADADDVTVVPPVDASDWLAGVEADRPFDGEDVYLSVDVDAFDPAYAPGTGTPEPFGLTPREGRRAVRALAPASVGFDAVEVTDRDDGQAAVLAAKLLREFVYSHAAER